MEEQAPKLALLRGSTTTRAEQELLLIKKRFSEAVYSAVLSFWVEVCVNLADLVFSLGARRWMLVKVNFLI